MHPSAWKLTVAILALAISIQAPLWAQSNSQSNSLMGTWKLDLAKSTFDPGPPPKSTTVKYEPYRKSGVRVTVDTVDARGILTHAVYTAEYNGKDYPAKGDSARDTVALQRIDDHTTEVTNKRRGKITSIDTIVVADDGKTRTVAIKGTNEQGQTVNNLAFFEKQ